MITTKFYLDTRKESNNGEYPILIRITNNRKVIMFTTGVKAKENHWNGSALTSQDSNSRAKNARLRHIMDEVEKVVYEEEKKESVDNARLKKTISEKVFNKKTQRTFLDIIDEFIQTKDKNGTTKVYINLYKKIEQFDASVTLESITPMWLTDFEKKMHSDGYKTNYISIQLRSIRAVFNFAINKEYTNLYPFRKYKIRTEQTEKRSLVIEQVRQLRDYPCEEYQVKYRDLFMLMIYMIGINSADLFLMPPLNGKKISYIRKKTDKETATNVRRIEFTLQPEAEEIIKKYAGKKYMLDVMDTYNNHVDFLHRMNIGLQKMGKMQKVGRGGKKVIEPAFPGITSYWARHTWATLAAQLDIPKETIGAALGHAGNSVTDIYIDFDRKKIDEANRKVIDFINQKN